MFTFGIYKVKQRRQRPPNTHTHTHTHARTQTHTRTLLPHTTRGHSQAYYSYKTVCMGSRHQVKKVALTERLGAHDVKLVSGMSNQHAVGILVFNMQIETIYH